MEHSNIVSVDDDGTITGLVVGRAIVTVITEDGNFRGSCNVEVISNEEEKSKYWFFNL